MQSDLESPCPTDFSNAGMHSNPSISQDLPALPGRIHPEIAAVYP